MIGSLMNLNNGISGAVIELWPDDAKNDWSVWMVE